MRKKSEDLSGMLREWEFNPTRPWRKVRAADGREVLQVRLPLGVEQYEIDGRPDGKRPEGRESWLHHFQRRARLLGREFLLDEKDCEKLASEGVLYYYRYLLFFQIGDYARCSRDTARNLRLLDFVASYASKPEYAEPLEQYRPYILRMHIMSRTLRKLEERKNVRAALKSLRHGVETIRGLPEMEGNQVFEFERDRSIESLEDLIRQLDRQVPLSPRQKLKKEMEEAISREDYEKAATIRDELKRIRKH